jgi:peptidoglycan/LPS O-acetylase OafA/YrhL
MQRLTYLDGLRGLASFFVLLYHFFLMDWIKELLPPSVAKVVPIVFNGTDCVSLFFVLSGLVLALPYAQASGEDVLRDYPRFFFSRLFRLFPIYAVAYFFTFMVGIIPSIQRGTFWVDVGYNAIVMTKELLMIRGEHPFYIPGWSLEVELLIGAFVPFMLLLARQRSAFWLVFGLCVVGNPTLSVHLGAFLLGGWLAHHFTAIQQLNIFETKIYRFRYVFYLLFIFAFSARHFHEIIQYHGKNHLNSVMNIFGLNFSHFSAWASFALITWILLRIKWQKILSLRFFVWLGHISYCLYLLHWLVVFAVVRTFWIPYVREQHWSNWHLLLSSFALAVGLSLLLAHLFHFYIELPMIRYFKQKVPKIAAWWSR